MIKIYIRKLKEHDITHEVSVRKNIVEDFFENSTVFDLVSKKSGEKYEISINDATDPRFGGGFKSLLRDDGDVNENDYIIFYKKNQKYELEIVRTSDDRFQIIDELCKDSERHTILSVEIPKDEEMSYTEETLGKILREYYDNKQYNTNTGIMMFGIIYGEYIEKNNKEKTKIIKSADIAESYIAELNKAIRLREFVAPINLNKSNIKVDLNSETKVGGFNTIFYGIPGCGKSFTANHFALDFTTEEFVLRTTFYPDYTNSDFVGQIIPQIDDSDKNTVIYDIQAGPFTNALAKAIDNPNKFVCLIIEEINRGNASATFGDTFQLLDRNKKGESEYGIRNYILSEYLNRKCVNKNYDYNNIKIPSNLIIIGTMNTSDQNVFTLDTAFKRRWGMKFISNDINKSIYKDQIVPGLNITWKEFVTGVNDLITSSDDELGINGEDKQIGSYFISGQEWGKINKLMEENNVGEAARLFGEKMLSYLWEDVAKLDKMVIFNKDFKTFDEVITRYVNGEDILNIETKKD